MKKRKNRSGKKKFGKYRGVKPVPINLKLLDELNIPHKGWCVNAHGYVLYNTNATKPETTKGLVRYARRCRVVVSRLLALDGKEIDPAFQVHHMDFNKQHDCPQNLLYCEVVFNNVGHVGGTGGGRRDPYTGESLSEEEYQRRYS